MFIAHEGYSEPLFQNGAPELPAEAQIKEVPSFAGLAQELSPAVVNISVEGGVPRIGDPKLEPQLKEKDPDPADQFRSSGSGFIIHPDGYIITSNHVIDRSDEIIIRLLNDKTEYKAKVIGKDKKTDLALLKIDAKAKLPVVYFGDSDAIEVGQWVVAIGNQFELGQTVTAGIISAKSRRIPSKDSGPYDQYIQTDASINPGSSGGPLFNIRGQVIGVNTAIFTPGRGGVGFNIGIGFAIPSNLVQEVVEQLKEKGRVTRSMLGVIVQPIDQTMAQALGLASPSGALVAEVLKESPADRAGFMQRDVVVSFDGHTIDDYEDLPLLVSRTPVSKSVTVEVLRAGVKKSLQVQVAELREAESVPSKKYDTPDTLGIRIDVVTEDLRKAMKLGAQDGVLITTVEPNSRAAISGMSPGDVILEIKGERITGIDAYKRIVQTLPQDKAVLVLMQRKDGTRFVALKAR